MQENIDISDINFLYGAAVSMFFTVQLDFRRNFRKQTSLHGTYEVLSKGAHGGGIIHITNISRGGLGFTVSGLHDIQKGQLVQVEFQLNDKKKTVLNKQAVIRTVNKNSIGCEFRYNTDTDKALGFFPAKLIYFKTLSFFYNFSLVTLPSSLLHVFSPNSSVTLCLQSGAALARRESGVYPKSKHQ